MKISCVIISLLLLMGLNGWEAGIASAQRAHSPKETGSFVTEEEALEIVEFHNRVRAGVGSRPLLWSKEIAAYAQEWVDHLAKTDCSLRHRPSSGKFGQRYGENGFLGFKGHHDIREALRVWEDENQDYHGQAITGSNYRLFGHYTQMVWKTTARIGCGKAECHGRILFFCNYDPRGNILGDAAY